MRSLYAVGLVTIASSLLVCCIFKGGEGEEGGNVSDSKYKLKIGGVGTHVTTSTELKATVEIMHDNQLVSEGDVASSKVTLTIKCGDNQVAEQKDKAATAGKVVFDAIKVEGDNFTGDCTLTVSAKPAGEDVSTEHKFKVSDQAVITLPEPTTNDEDELPTAPNTALVGRPFVVPSTAATLKVQPNELCDGALVLVYYNESNKTVREVLTAGEAVKPVKGVVSGLAVVKAKANVDLEKKCKSEDADDKDDKDEEEEDEEPPPSIVVAISPGFPKGLRLKISEASDAPSLANASLSDDNGLKLSWSTATGFDDGADVFFNNRTEGNEWTRHSDTLEWSNASKAISTLDYVEPVKALVKVNLSGDGGDHWLYFRKPE